MLSSIKAIDLLQYQQWHGGVSMVNCQLLRLRLGIIFPTHNIGHILSQVFAVEFYQLVTGEDIYQPTKSKSSVS